MYDQQMIDIHTKIEELCIKALRDHRYQDAVDHGISAYLFGRDLEPKSMHVVTLDFIRMACEAIVANEKKSRGLSKEKSTCSFCGKSEPAVRLAAGQPGVFICNECSARVSKSFKEQEEQT